MQSVRQIAEEIVAREGGFVNDPADPGGATKHGVTIHTLRRLGVDLDGDGDVDVADVHRIDRKLATDIFVRHYFDGPGLARLPTCVQPSVFDMYVNAGTNAVKILQKLICDRGSASRWTASSVRKRWGPRRFVPPSRRAISPMPTGSHAGTTITG